MTKERFNELIDELESTSIDTLKSKNAKYAPADDALHNFHAGAEIMGTTTAQCIWGYATKHIVALRDKIINNDWNDMDDVLEKIQDIQNYLRFIWCAANEENENKSVENETICTMCDTNCRIEERSCECCKYRDKCLEELDEEPCASCKYNFVFGTPEYNKAKLKWEPLEQQDD